MDQGLNQKIDAYIAENKEQLLRDIAALLLRSLALFDILHTFF